MRSVRRRPAVAPTEEQENSADYTAFAGGCHLARDNIGASLTRLELGFMRVHEAFASWAVELHKHVRGPQLGFVDIALLHSIRLRGGSATLGEILIFQHRHDLSSIQYSVKKLQARSLLKKVRGGSKREIAYEITALGNEITSRYAELRDEVLVALCAGVVGLESDMGRSARTLERLIGVYDQATQALMNSSLLRRQYRKGAPVEGNGLSHSPGSPRRDGEATLR
jgi:predicted MarR family transcription regulator